MRLENTFRLLIKNLKDFEIYKWQYYDIVVRQIYTKYINFEGDEIVADVGANRGMFSMFVARSVRWVYAIEPSPNNLEYLATNLYLNRIENAEIISCGVWENDGRLKLRMFEGGDADSFVRESKDQIDEYGEQITFIGEIEVPVVRLDRIVKDADFIKMDVEGAEVQVLKGSEKLLERGADLAIAAYHRYTDKHRIVSMLRSYGYLVIDEGEIIYGRCRR